MQDYHLPPTAPRIPPLRNTFSLRITGQEDLEAGTTTS
jgi:hypothetical protein